METRKERSKPTDIDQAIKNRLKDYPGLSKLTRNDPFGPEDNIVTRPQNLSREQYPYTDRDRNRDLDRTRDRILGSRPTIDESETNVVNGEPNFDPHNDMDKYLKPSEYLKYNIVPPMEEIFWLDYNLSLDIRNDGISTDNHIPEYTFQFSRFGNISRVELVSIIVTPHPVLEEEPYVFINFKEISGRCHLSNGTRTFGKIMLMPTSTSTIEGDRNKRNLIYVPEECFQNFSRPITLENLTVSFCDSSGIPINIREIKVSRVLRPKSQPELIIECHRPHYLIEGEKIEVQIIKTVEIESYEVEVLSVIDATSFRIKNDFQDLTRQIRIFKTKINLSFTLKFSEINWFLLNDNNVTSTQLIKLSELVKAKTRQATENPNE